MHESFRAWNGRIWNAVSKISEYDRSVPSVIDTDRDKPFC